MQRVLEPRLFLLLAALALLAGCSTRMVYENTDFYVVRYVDHHVSLEPGQVALVESRVESLLAWHRVEALPGYVDWLDGVAAAVGGGEAVAAEDVAGWTRDLVGFWRELARRMAPDLVVLAAGLDDRQVGELVEELREGQARRRQEHADRAETRDDRARSMERFVKRWTGRLSRPQRALVEDWAARLTPTTDLWLASREGWIRELEAALARRDDRAALEAAVQRLVVDPAARWDPAYRAAIRDNAALTHALLAELVNGLDPRQRARARERIGDLARTLEALAVEP